MFGDKNFKSFIPNMKALEREEKQLKPEIYGKRQLMPKLKRELLTCFTKILAIENRTNKI